MHSNRSATAGPPQHRALACPGTNSGKLVPQGLAYLLCQVTINATFQNGTFLKLPDHKAERGLAQAQKTHLKGPGYCELIL